MADHISWYFLNMRRRPKPLPYGYILRRGHYAEFDLTLFCLPDSSSSGAPRRQNMHKMQWMTLEQMSFDFNKFKMHLSLQFPYNLRSDCHSISHTHLAKLYLLLRIFCWWKILLIGAWGRKNSNRWSLFELKWRPVASADLDLVAKKPNITWITTLLQ